MDPCRSGDHTDARTHPATGNRGPLLEPSGGVRRLGHERARKLPITAQSAAERLHSLLTPQAWVLEHGFCGGSVRAGPPEANPCQRDAHGRSLSCAGREVCSSGARSVASRPLTSPDHAGQVLPSVRTTVIAHAASRTPPERRLAAPIRLCMNNSILSEWLSAVELHFGRPVGKSRTVAYNRTPAGGRAPSVRGRRTRPCGNAKTPTKPCAYHLKKP